MSATVAPLQTDIFTAVCTVLNGFGLTSATAGAPVQVIRGQVNRVPSPAGQDYVVIWPINRSRIAMNIDTFTDTIVTGSITTNILTVTSVVNGPALPGAILYGAAVSVGCYIISQITGLSGGVGTYAVAPTANVTSQPMYCGTDAHLQETEVTIQADVHGPASADNAARISTLWRDDTGYEALQAANIAIAPLYTSEPKQIPFDNGEQQVEERWMVDLCMQANIVVTTTQQFAATLKSTSTPVYTLGP
jgi:hypothetical protein